MTTVDPDETAAFAVDADALAPGRTATATFGMGCFWGPDARFGAVDGVVRTRVGYAGGTDPDPSYYSLGDHTEVVQVEYDPDALAYEDLLEVFWANHDPFSSPYKRQYRGVALAHDDAQREAAER
jgi:peptide-methionine (S)-S-oxide reductase